jgi:hypothetical protein
MVQGPGRFTRPDDARHARDDGAQVAEQEHAEHDPAAEQRRRTDPEDPDSRFPWIVKTRDTKPESCCMSNLKP